jgi:capsular polysaccharide biosynthesis protein
MARLWLIRAHPELPVLWHEIALPVPHGPWPGWQQQVWHLLGLDRHDHVVIRQPRRFGHVIVPHPGLSLAHGLHPEQASALAVVPAVPPASERVWLSRTALPSQFGRLLGEEVLERHLADRGWIVLRPESMRVADQANVFARADTVAGFASSAFHAVLLCASPRARLRILRRPSVRTENYDLIAQARGLHQVYIDVALRPLGAIDAWTTFDLTDPLAAADAVDCSR